MTDPVSAAADQLDAAVAATIAALQPTTDIDWARAATDLTWSVFDTAEHLASCLIGYAGQVVGQPTEGWVVPDVPLESGMSPAAVITYVGAAGGILASVVRTAAPDARGYHPYGTSDPVGFAAMGVVESLVHTYDIRLTAGQPWALPAGPAEFALRRLFPDAPAGSPTDVLLWCTGRTSWGEHPRRTQWRWDSTVRPLGG